LAESLLGKAAGGAASNDRGIVLVTAAAAADIKTARRGSNMPLPLPSAVMRAGIEHRHAWSIS